MKVELCQKRQRGNECGGRLKYNYWKKSAPFLVNPRALLTHRVRQVYGFTMDGEFSHYVIHLWCDGSCTGADDSNIVHQPPESRLLCQRCEAIAIINGQPSADTLAGRHVHIGGIKDMRTCCTDEAN